MMRESARIYTYITRVRVTWHVVRRLSQERRTCPPPAASKGPCHDLRVVCFSTALRRLNEQEWMLPCEKQHRKVISTTFENADRLRRLQQQVTIYG